MIYRVVVGVVLTAALVGVATPAMSAASATAADSTVDRQMSALSERLQRMVDTDDSTRGRGARLVTDLRLPGRSLTSAGVTRLRLTNRAGVSVATWQVGEATRSHAPLVGVPVRAAGGNLTLRGPDTYRLAFHLRSQSGRTVLTVDRLGGRNP